MTFRTVSLVVALAFVFKCLFGASASAAYLPVSSDLNVPVQGPCVSCVHDCEAGPFWRSQTGAEAAEVIRIGRNVIEVFSRGDGDEKRIHAGGL